jgi:hypothetical protein
MDGKMGHMGKRPADKKSGGPDHVLQIRGNLQPYINAQIGGGKDRLIVKDITLESISNCVYADNISDMAELMKMKRPRPRE